MANRRIPHPESRTEVRQAFQRLDKDVKTLEERDHGDLEGLTDDDHTQYHNNTRGDARYYTETELDAGQLDNRYFTESEHLSVSAGAGDANKPIKLDADGQVDATMLNDADIDHNSTTNTHNLTTDINHNAITNTHNLTTDINHASITGAHNLTTDIDHNQLTNYDANKHIDHTGVTLTAGSGLSGGGDISANRTFDLNINGLDSATIEVGDFIPFWDITETATNKKLTFLNFLTTSSGVSSGGGGGGAGDPGGGVGGDAGLVWTDLGTQHSCYTIQDMCSLGNGIVIAATGSGGKILRSTDYGATWDDLGQQGSATYLCSACNIGSGVAVVGTNNGKILRTTNHGVTWTDLGVLTDASTIYALCYVGGGIVVAGGNGARIWRSTDYGATWSLLGPQYSQSIIYSLCNIGNGIVLAGTAEYGKILRSTDYGATWDDLGQQGSMTRIYGIAYAGNGIVLAGGYSGGKIIRSIDYGVTWTDLGQQASQVSINCVASLGGGILIAGTSNSGLILRSTDWGATWISLGIMANYVESVADIGDGIALAGGTSSGKILRSATLDESGPGDFRYLPIGDFIDTSAGAADAGKPIILDAEGHIDASMINDADVDHDATTNTHNLTTDIDHDSITNTHNLTTDVDHASITNTHNLTTDIDHASITNTHNLTTDIDHNAITNYDANKHVDHTGVSITAGSGLTGGGTINSTRTLSLDINGLTGEAAIAAADTLAFYDATAEANRKITFSEFETALAAGADKYVGIDAGATPGYLGAASNDGVLRSSTGLSYTDGGDYVTLALSHLGIEALTDPGEDRILFWDDGETACKWLTLAGTAAGISGTTLTNNAGYVGRSDPPWDFDEGDLIHDSTFRDLDLSSIVPVGSYAAVVRVRIYNSTVDKSIYIRQKGDSASIMQCNVQAANTWSNLASIVLVDSNRKIEYWSNGADQIDIQISGWFI